jgi:hypothetical protein
MIAKTAEALVTPSGPVPAPVENVVAAAPEPEIAEGPKKIAAKETKSAAGAGLSSTDLVQAWRRTRRVDA